MEFFGRFKNVLVLILVLLTQTIALAVQVRRVPDASQPDPHPVRLLRLWAAAIVTPVARSAHFVGGGVRGGWSNYVALWHVRQENQALRNQLAGIRLQQAAEAEDVMEGRRLQALLEFREHYIASTVAAQVIGTSGNEQSRMLLLDKGADAGLKPDMPVITPDGIVGKLRDVFPHSSQLLLISDPTAGAGVMLESSRIRAILRGTASGRVQIGNLLADSRIQPGERVLTSGGDQVFPRGLAVGVVESIAQDPDHQPYTAITVRPAAKLTQLEEVLVVTGTQPDLPLEAQTDLKTAEARHLEDVEAAKAAAAVVAANQPRGLDLSGLTPEEKEKAAAAAEANDAAKTAGPGATPGGVVPKPAPVVHPDRYSPGTTPSADDLTPGAAGGARPQAASGAEDPAKPAAPGVRKQTATAAKAAARKEAVPASSSGDGETAPPGVRKTAPPVVEKTLPPSKPDQEGPR